MNPMRVLSILTLMFACLAAFLFAANTPAANAQAFYLKSGDTVVFYGDSITEQNYYNQWVELYTVTRFPAMRVHFFGEGVGGDRVSGGGGGPIDQRLQRDVFPHKPTVVTVMLGMNDGSYQATTSKIEGDYVSGYQHLLESLRANAPGARLTLLGPSPYDEVTRALMFPGGYNAVMEHFAGIDRGLAQKYGALFIDLNAPVVAAIDKAEAADPDIAPLLLPDRVHPDPLAHWVMAAALLKGWNAPALVSSVTIDGRAGKVAAAENAAVTGVEQNGGTLRWTATENALPLPLNPGNANTALLEKLTGIEEELNRESLTVNGLAAGLYTISIDGKPLGHFTAADLAAGVNLAAYGTPMRHQADEVSWLVRDRDEANYIHLRMRIRNAAMGGPEGSDVLDGFENSLEDSIYEKAAPMPHVFELRPADAQP